MSMIASFVFVSMVLAAGPCKTIETTITGDSMQGMLFHGQKITVYTTACGTFNRYDYLLFTNEQTENAVVKQLWGMPGDTIKVSKNGSFTINGVQALNPFKRPYILMGPYKTRLSKLQEHPLDGYLLLGHPGSLDSGRVGLIDKSEIIGFVKRGEPHVLSN